MYMDDQRSKDDIQGCRQWRTKDFLLGGAVYSQVKRLNNKIVFLRSYQRHFLKHLGSPLGVGSDTTSHVASKADLVASMGNDVFKRDTGQLFDAEDTPRKSASEVGSLKLASSVIVDALVAEIKEASLDLVLGKRVGNTFGAEEDRVFRGWR